MKTWKNLLLIGIVVAGFGAVYLMSSKTQKTTPAPQVASVPNDPKPAGYDPDLILPPPDVQGIVVDLPATEVRQHFEAMAGLKLPKDVEQSLIVPPPPDALIPVEGRTTFRASSP